MAVKGSGYTSEVKVDASTLSSTLERDSFAVIPHDFYEPKSVLESHQAGCSVLSLCESPCQALPKLYRKKNSIGRPMYMTTKLLATILNKNGKPLRKEYIRCQIIRAIRKCVKRMINGLKAATGLLRFLPSDVDLIPVWQQMEQLVVSNKDFFASATNTTPRTYNDTYCRCFYSPALIRHFHFLCMQVAYGVDTVIPKRICERMESSCCRGSHNIQCVAKWEQLRNYVTFEMLEELGLRPFTGLQEGNADNTAAEDVIDDPDMFFA